MSKLYKGLRASLPKDQYDQARFIDEAFTALEAANGTKELADPGDGAALPAEGGHVKLVSAAAETRTLASPTAEDQRLKLTFLEDGGDVVVTAADPVNDAGNTSLTFADVGDILVLESVKTGAQTFEWRVLANEGVALA